MTYSKSTGLAWIPVDGGATQPATLPGSVTPTISDSTNALSSAVGSQDATSAAHSSSATSCPSGLTRRPANVPTLRLKPTCGSFELLAHVGERAVPSVDALPAIGDEVVAQRLVERRQRRRLALADAVVGRVGHHRGEPVQPVVVVAALLVEAPLEAGGEVVGGVGRRLGAEQVERHAAMEVEVALQRRHVDAAERPDVGGVVLLHQLHRSFDDPPDPRGPDEHVVGLFLEHEVARARERVEPRLAQGGELELAIAIGEVGEHEERQPVRGRLVERSEDARLVGVAGVPLEHLVRLVPAVAPEVAVQQVHHGPEVAALLDVDLEQVAQVVQARRRRAQVALLFDGRRLGVALHDDQPAQVGAMLAGDFLPHRLAEVVAEGDPPVRLGLGEEDPPSIVGHLDVVEVRPAFLADVDRRPQVHVVVLEGDRAELLPPLDELRLPRLQGALQPAVAGEVDVVGDLGFDVDGRLIWQLRPGLVRRSYCRWDGRRCRSGTGRHRGRPRSVAGRSSSATP